MSQVRIVNWLLTRKCNLKCDYCGIVRNYAGQPYCYPDMSYYIKNEMTTEIVINALKGFKIHNPNIFHIFYGGEPLLRPDLPDIINYCNDNEIYYTIISNNTPEIQPLLRKLFDKVDHVEGFTSSVDPIFNEIGVDEDSIKKSIEGLKRLKEIQAAGLVKDVVAEITVMNHNQHLLYELVSDLSEEEIYSDITFVDMAKNFFYDFSNVRDKSALVKPSFDLAVMFQALLSDDKLLIHMKDLLLPQMFDTLPSNFDCELEHGLHNLTIDADGSMRLCLRIKGMSSQSCKVTELFDKEYPSLISSVLFNMMIFDKQHYCKLCNHSCLMMSKYIDETNKEVDDLVHSDKREGK
jgi:MoaA/NifB/PqqE/SkfB family radical SAM enzyme